MNIDRNEIPVFAWFTAPNVTQLNKNIPNKPKLQVFQPIDPNYMPNLNGFSCK